MAEKNDPKLDDVKKKLSAIDDMETPNTTSSKSATSTKARLAEIEKDMASKTSSRTRERLAFLEKELAMKTTTRTREKLAELETLLENQATTTKTRERMIEIEKQLADASFASTSTRTREQLAAAEQKLEELNKETSSITKEKLDIAKRRIADGLKKKQEYEALLEFESKAQILLNKVNH